MADNAGKAAMKRLLFLSLLTAASLTQSPAWSAGLPDPTSLAYRQQLGARLPMQQIFHDADGRPVRLGGLPHGLTTILVLAYFRCPNLCGIVRADLFHALGAAELEGGRDYELVVLSIDPSETSADAASAKTRDLSAFALPGAAKSWHYLTGSAKDVQAVADAVGFRDQLDQDTKQFIHPAGIVFVTPSGNVSSYLLGVGYTPVDVRSAVERADAGAIAAVASPVLLLCFHFDPVSGRYTLDIIKLFRLAGLLSVGVIAGMLFLLFRGEGSRS